MGSRLDAPADGMGLGGEVVQAQRLPFETRGGVNGLVHSGRRSEPAPPHPQILSAISDGGDGAMVRGPL